MIELRLYTHPDFSHKEVEQLYYENRKTVIYDNPNLSYEEFVKIFNPWIFAGYSDDVFKGCMYLHWIDKKCFLSGFAVRKSHKEIIEAIQILCKHLMETYKLHAIYTKPSNKAALFCDLRVGFKHFKDDIYIIRGN